MQISLGIYNGKIITINSMLSSDRRLDMTRTASCVGPNILTPLSLWST